MPSSTGETGDCSDAIARFVNPVRVFSSQICSLAHGQSLASRFSLAMASAGAENRPRPRPNHPALVREDAERPGDRAPAYPEILGELCLGRQLPVGPDVPAHDGVRQLACEAVPTAGSRSAGPARSQAQAVKVERELAYLRDTASLTGRSSLVTARLAVRPQVLWRV